MICLGGDKIFPRQNYSRLNADIDIIWKCPNKKACRYIIYLIFIHIFQEDFITRVIL